MIERYGVALLGVAFLLGCAQESAETESSEPTAETVAEMPLAGQVALACQPSNSMPLEDRASPYDSTAVAIGDAEAKLCYGRPSAREREIFGGLVPYDTIWRTGANEPTTIHLPVAAEIAGIRVEPGSYSLYTIPSSSEWTVIVNRSTSQWGIESQYTEEIKAQEVGRSTVPAETIPEPVEVFTIEAQAGGDGGSDLVLEWERTRVRIPIRPA